MEPETVAHVADESVETIYSNLLPHHISKLPEAVITHQKCCEYSCLSYFTASEIGSAQNYFKSKNAVEQNQFL